MMSKSDSVHPPHVAIWLVNLFTPSKEAESIIGDLLEEYSHLCSQSGVAFARSWYWRQTLKTIADFTIAGYRAAPWSAIAAILGGWLLHGFLNTMLGRAFDATTDKYLLYWSNHFKLYVFLARDGMVIAHLIVSTLVGALVGFAARGREMFATMTLFVLGAMGVIRLLVVVLIGQGRHIVFWGVAWYFAGLCAIVIGGAIVRMRRSAPSTRLSGA